MPTTEKITLHALPPSHPCMTAEAGLRHKNLDYELVNLTMGRHQDEIEAIYGDGARTVPGMLVGDEPVHGSVAILRRLEQLEPGNPLYPADRATGVIAAEDWADGRLQDMGRRLPWGAMHFRPQAMGSFGGGDDLDPAGVDHAMKFIHGTWKYHGITAVQLARDLADLPAMIERIEGYADEGILGGGQPTAADLQIGSTIRVLLTVGDLRPALSGSAAERIALRYFPDYAGLVPEGAFPSGWLEREG